MYKNLKAWTVIHSFQLLFRQERPFFQKENEDFAATFDFSHCFCRLLITFGWVSLRKPSTISQWRRSLPTWNHSEAGDLMHVSAFRNWFKLLASLKYLIMKYLRIFSIVRISWKNFKRVRHRGRSLRANWTKHSVHDGEIRRNGLSFCWSRRSRGLGWGFEFGRNLPQWNEKTSPGYGMVNAGLLG